MPCFLTCSASSRVIFIAYPGNLKVSATSTIDSIRRDLLRRPSGLHLKTSTALASRGRGGWLAPEPGSAPGLPRPAPSRLFLEAPPKEPIETGGYLFPFLRPYGNSEWLLRDVSGLQASSPN